MNPTQRVAHLVLVDLILLHEFAERPSNPFHPAVKEFLFDVPHAHVMAVEGRELSDPMAHLAGADDRKFHRRFSRGWDGAAS
jgi:hypothetical protein